MAEEKKRNALPPLLANHSMANKYKFIDYDDQAGEWTLPFYLWCWLYQAADQHYSDVLQQNVISSAVGVNDSKDRKSVV